MSPALHVRVSVVVLLFSLNAGSTAMTSAVDVASPDIVDSRLTSNSANESLSVSAGTWTDAKEAQPFQQLGTTGVSTYSSSRLHEASQSKQHASNKHKPLWPLDTRDWWTVGIATVAIFVAAGGGIGGGGVLVPLYASVLGKHPQ